MKRRNLLRTAGQLSIIVLVTAAASVTVRAQSSDTASGFYRPLTLAPAETTSGGAAANGAAREEQTEKLAREVQNPVANLISVPFQNNFNFGMGPNNAMQYVLNIQPVIPITLSEDWNLITRTIMPIINQPSPAPGIASASGLGDINPTFFFSPAKASKLIWGVGPTFTLPTATDGQLGHGKWCAGPAAVGLVMHGLWVVGALVNNQWSFAGYGSGDVNAMLIQPFINYNLPKGWYLTSAPIITADWESPSDNRWVVPVGAGVGKIIHLGRLPLNVQLSAFYNVKTPEPFGADWQLRFQLQFLFPK